MTILDLAFQTGIKPKWVASTHGGEFHSSCPLCGGKDRFYIQPYRQMANCAGLYCCRQCGISGDTIEFARQFLNYSFQEAAQAINDTFPARSAHFLPKKFYSPKLITLQPPNSLWIKQATALTEYAHSNIHNNKVVLNYLLKRGLTSDAITKYKLGWLNDNKSFPKTKWGLSEQSNQNRRPNLWIPKGLLIPSIDHGMTIRLKVRRANWDYGDKLPKYIAISGSMSGLTIIGSKKMNIVIVVESELDAYVIHYATGYFACVVAVGSNIKNPDNITDHLAKKASHLLICHDNDTAGKKMLDKWRNLYSHAKAYPTPMGKDVGEAIEKGLEVKSWILDAISD